MAINTSIADLTEKHLQLIAEERAQRKEELRTLDEELQALDRMESALRQGAVPNGESPKREPKRRDTIGDRLANEIAEVLKAKGPTKLDAIRTELKSRGVRATQGQIQRILYGHKSRFYRPQRGVFNVKG